MQVGGGGACFSNGLTVSCTGDWLPLVLIPLLLACLGVAVIASVLLSSRRVPMPAAGGPSPVPPAMSRFRWGEALALGALFCGAVLIWVVVEGITYSAQLKAVRFLPSWAVLEIGAVVGVLLAALLLVLLVGYLVTGRNILGPSRRSFRSSVLGVIAPFAAYTLMSLYAAAVLQTHPQLWWIPIAIVNLLAGALLIWMTVRLVRAIRHP